MHILVDESVGQQVVARLRNDGHDVLYVAEMSPGIDDEEVLGAANEHDALLLTADKDFGELVFRLGRVSRGVMLLRLSGIAAEEQVAAVSTAIAQHEAELLDAFSVVSPRTVRIRPLN